MAVPKSKEARVHVGWLVTNVMEHPCYIVFGCLKWASIKRVWQKTFHYISNHFVIVLIVVHV